MTDASYAATGWSTLNSALAMGFGLLVCLLVAFVGSKVLARRGQEHYLPAVVLVSFVVAMALAMIVLMTHHTPDKLVHKSGSP